MRRHVPGAGIAAAAVAVVLSGCMQQTPIGGPAPSASVEARSLVRIHGDVSYPCRGFRLGKPSGIRIVFKTRLGTLLGKATTGQTRFTTRSDGGCSQEAAYSITLPKRPIYVVRDPIRDRDVFATLEQLIHARFRWDFGY